MASIEFLNSIVGNLAFAADAEPRLYVAAALAFKFVSAQGRAECTPLDCEASRHGKRIQCWHPVAMSSSVPPWLPQIYGAEGGMKARARTGSHRCARTGEAHPRWVIGPGRCMRLARRSPGYGREAVWIRFLRLANHAITPRPVAKRGRAGGTGTAFTCGSRFAV